MAQAVLSRFQMLQEQNAQDALTVNNVAAKIREEFEDFRVPVAPESVEDYAKVVNHTTLAMKKFSNSQFKATTSLDVSDLEQIKNALRNFACEGEHSKQIKDEIINDLTDFQKRINTMHFQNIAEHAKQKQSCEKELRTLEFAKHKLIADRLSKILWPYDAKTKEYDAKIALLQTKIQQYEQKISYSKKLRPVANAKDILLYEMKLKEKYLQSA